MSWKERIIEIKQDRIGDYLPNSNNAKRHPKKQFSALRQSLEKIGKAGVLMAYKSERAGGKIILWDGHARQSLDKDEVWHIAITDLTDAEADQMLLTYDAIAGLAEWDKELTAALLQLNEAIEGDLADLASRIADEAGLSLDNGSDAHDADAKIEIADELQKKWATKLGQIWILPSRDGKGEHRIICGDSKDPAIFASLMCDEKASVVFTDPPYGVSIGAKNRLLNQFQKSGRVLTDIIDDDLPADSLRDMLVDVFTNVKNFAADNCTYFVTSPQGGDIGFMMMTMMRNVGLAVRHILIWKKNSPTFSLGRLDYDYQHEPILLTWTKSHKRPMNGTMKTSVWEIDKPRSSKLHPTMKPVELYENAYLNNSDKGDVSLEPFSGSGTAIIAAENTGRYCRAIEISPSYVAVALERYFDAFGVEPLLWQPNSQKL